ncbi:MAG TPA: hypothetical protein GX707_03485, partial [Epulopiscium sp.]|nr:hypothetical protein [Candidatus Epulonipiscium sp.]
DNESGFPRSKFEFLSAVIFSLIGNLDEIQYTPKDEENYSQPAHIMSRQEIDNITLSVMGSHTQEIGNNQGEFQKLVRHYENHSAQTDDTGSDTLPSSPIDTSDLLSSTHENINDLKDVNMAVKAGSIQTKGLSLLFENKTKKTVIYGDDFILEQEVDGIWYQVPITIEGNYGFHDIAYEMLPNEINVFTVDWEWLYGNLKPGKYRIIKSVLDFRDPGDFDSYYLAAKFKIQF